MSADHADGNDGLLQTDHRYCRCACHNGRNSTCSSIPGCRCRDGALPSASVDDGFRFRDHPLKMPLPLSAEDAFRHASFGIPYEPTSVPVVYDRDVPTRGPVYGLNQHTWGGVVPRDDDDVMVSPLTNENLDMMAAVPAIFAPENPYYRKTHVNAPGTVRSWFRKMRAADFERAVNGVAATGPDVQQARVMRWRRFYPFDYLPPWTLFDTQQVVDRETANHYRPWPSIVKVLIGRGEFQPNEARGITLEDVRRFVREDDRLRWQRPGAYRITGITPPEGY